MPAFLAVNIASLTPARGGSIIPMSPTNTKSFSMFSEFILFGRDDTSLYAIAITRKASVAIFSFAFSILF